MEALESSPWMTHHRVDLLVGDAFRNNAHFVDMQTMYSQPGCLGAVPVEDDPAGIRTAFWLASDHQYKAAAETFERKLSALRQQQQSPAWLSTPDLDQAVCSVRNLGPGRSPVDSAHWERTIRELSAVPLRHPGIHSSEVSFHFVRGERYFNNSQKGRVILPVTLAALQVSLKTQADDGTPLADHIVHLARTPGQLPEPARVKQEVAAAAAHLEALRQAAVLDESYDGPVLFEGQAVAELFAQRLFSPGAKGLVAVRKPVFADRQTEAMVRKLPESLEDKLQARILPQGFRVTATPLRETFQNTPLIGAFAVDAQAVVPPAEVVLVEGGILKDLLQGRTPHPSVRSATAISARSWTPTSWRTPPAPGWWNSHVPPAARWPT